MDFSPIVLPIRLTKENFKEIYSMINQIRTGWNSSNTELRSFTEGITNTIYGLFHVNDDQQSDGLVIKLFGEQTELFIDRQSELEAMIQLSKQAVLSQRIRIQFANGFIYEYAPGRPCSRDDLRKTNIARLIAHKLAQFHSVPIDKHEKPYFIVLTRKFVEILNEYPDERSNLDLYRSDIDLIENSILDDLISNPKLGEDLVLCHNDLLVKNIIYHEKSNQISFIDFEYTHLNYALFDIANHFVEYAGVDDADFSIYPTLEEQKDWLQIYYQERKIFSPIIDDKLCHKIRRFSSLAHLMWGLWALVQSHVSNIDFDYRNYAKLRLDSYRQLREILFENIEINR